MSVDQVDSTGRKPPVDQLAEPTGLRIGGGQVGGVGAERPFFNANFARRIGRSGFFETNGGGGLAYEKSASINLERPDCASIARQDAESFERCDEQGRK